MRIPISLVKRSVYARLHGDIPEVPFFEVVTPEVDPPFGVISDFKLDTDLCKDGELLAIQGSVYLWTRAEGMDQVEKIASDVLKSLGRADLDLSADAFRNYRKRLLNVLEPPSLTDGTNFYQQLTINYAWWIQDLQR